MLLINQEPGRQRSRTVRRVVAGLAVPILATGLAACAPGSVDRGKPTPTASSIQACSTLAPTPERSHVIGPVESPTATPLPAAPNAEITQPKGEQTRFFSISLEQFADNLGFLREHPNDLVGVTFQPHCYGITRDNPVDLKTTEGPTSETKQGDLGAIQLDNIVLTTFFPTGTAEGKTLENFVHTRRVLNQKVFLIGQILPAPADPLKLSELLEQRGLPANIPVVDALFVVIGAYSSQEESGAKSIATTQADIINAGSSRSEPQVLWAA